MEELLKRIEASSKVEYRDNLAQFDEVERALIEGSARGYRRIKNEIKEEGDEGSDLDLDLDEAGEQVTVQ